MCENKHASPKLNAGLFLVLILGAFQGLSSWNVASCTTHNERTENPPILAALGGSVGNQIVDFNAKGEDYRGEKISIDQTGGTIELNGTKIYFIPWKHLFWAEKNVDAFFLANVTRTNFYVAFLYFSNESSTFEVSIFDYASASYQKTLYQGKCLVTKTQSAARNILAPKLSFIANSKTENRLFAAGPDLFVTADRGYLKENRSLLSLYVLRNTISARLEWNEIWALLASSSGEYYFSIIYLNNQDSGKVLLGHALRRNDYYVLEQKQLRASWYTKSDSLQLSIEAPQEVRTYSIDGFQIQRAGDSRFTVTLNKGLHTIGVENTTLANNGVRLRFSQWSNGNKTNPLTVRVESNATLSAEYYKEFMLTIESQYVDTKITGWYREGQTVTIPNQKPVTKGDTMYQFDGWSEGAEGDGNNTVMVMNGPKTVRANWKAYFRLTLTTEGLPDGTKITYAVNGRSIPSETPHSIQDWIQEKTQLSFRVDLSESAKAKEHLFLKQWKNRNDTEIKSPTRLLGPEKLTATFTNQRQPTQLSCKVITADILSKGQLRIEGKMSPPKETAVVVEYRVIGEPWRTLHKVQTDAAGQYRYDWKPEVSGVLEIRAIWPGDETHSGTSSEPQGVAVSQSMQRFKTLAGTFKDTTSSIYNELNGPRDYSESLAIPFSAGIGAVDIVYASLAGLRPFGPILAIIAGSALVGIFYVLPWLVIVLVATAIVRRRPIKMRVVMPLLVILVLASLYLVLQEMNITVLLNLPHYILVLITAILASAAGLLTALLPSLGIANLLAKRWKSPHL